MAGGFLKTNSQNSFWPDARRKVVDISSEVNDSAGDSCIVSLLALPLVAITFITFVTCIFNLYFSASGV